MPCMLLPCFRSSDVIDTYLSKQSNCVLVVSYLNVRVPFVCRAIESQSIAQLHLYISYMIGRKYGRE